MRGKVIGKVYIGFHQISTSTKNEHQFRESTHIMIGFRKVKAETILLVTNISKTFESLRAPTAHLMTPQALKIEDKVLRYHVPTGFSRICTKLICLDVSSLGVSV